MEFHPSRKALFALFVYIIIPTYAILAAMVNYPELSKSRFIEIMKWILVIGVVLIIISQVQVRYERGSLQRYILNIAYVCVSLLWLLALFGGKPYIEQYWGEYQFRVVVWKILIIALIVGVLNVLYFTAEYVVYSKR
ncbi:MAG: hypothetical protein J7L88_04325 [Thermoplasmata archaeon]|nr:hypothetical protein [Thermoplasmata archaeon]